MAKKAESHIRIIENSVASKGKKTKVWAVLTADLAILLGHVKWMPGWRRYAFWPEEKTIFEQDCLRDVAEFVEKATKDHKESRP